MQIIAATDFSAAATNAARSAARLARRLGDSVLMVRVLEPPVAVYPELRVPDSEVFAAALRKSTEGQMETAAAALREEGVTVEGRVLTGSPARELVALAAEQSARLIVMGTHGHSALHSLLLGSVAERTVLGAPCPVLLVPERQSPFDGWSADRPLRLLVGYDLDAAGDAVLASVADLRKAGTCDVTLVHTYWPPAEYARLDLRGANDGVTDPDVVGALEHEIRARMALHGLPLETTLRIEATWGRVRDTLALDAGQDETDVLVLGTRQPHGWDRLKIGSVAIGALRRARTALLCVPARATAAQSGSAIPWLRTILVPTDFSDLANAAVPYAYSLLRGTGGTVELCHVHERHPTIPAYGHRAHGDLSSKARTELEAKLRSQVPPESEGLGIVTRVTVIEGNSPPDAILQASQRLSADAIALASHGRTGLVRTLMGSVAEAVLRGSSRPVFVVRPTAVPPDRAF